MNMFIYALNEEDRLFLLDKGYEELFTCRINGNKSYAFNNNLASVYATFSDDTKKRFLLSDVALYI